MLHRKYWSASALTLAAALATPAMAQDQMDHSQHHGHDMSTTAQAPAPAAPAPQPKEQTKTPQAPAPTVDHSQMDHSKMDHGQMNQGQMKAPEADMPSGGHEGHGEHTANPNYVDGSGTSRLPGVSGGHSGLHFMPGDDWMIMAHGYAWGVYTNQSGPRGDDKTYVQSMAMLNAEKSTDWGRVQLKSMFSLEPLMSNRGYPNLFATGETAGGIPLVDRQHPHDFMMELAARVDVNVAPGTSLFFYGGPVGEPAIGPSAFMHRGSALYNPEAPITHHWFDSTHITYGVATAGISSRKFQLEGSVFTGAEPNEERWGLDKMRFDSWSVRGTWNPNSNWSAQVSYGWFKEPEPTHPGVDTSKLTASVSYADDNGLSGTAAFGARNAIPGDTLTAWLLEANWSPDVGRRHNLFGRFENVANNELFSDHHHPLHDQTFRISKFQAGYAYRLPLADNVNLALGGSVAAFSKPDALDAFYGKSPMGYTLFAKLSLGH